MTLVQLKHKDTKAVLHEMEVSEIDCLERARVLAPIAEAFPSQQPGMPTLKASEVAVCLEDALLKGVDLTGVSLMACEVTFVNLTNLKLLDADLRATRFLGCHLHMASFERCQLRAMHIVGCDATHLTIADGQDALSLNVHKSTLDHLRVHNTNFASPVLVKSSWRNSRWTECGLSKLYANDGDFADVRFALSTMQGVWMNCQFPHSEWEGVVARQCSFDNAVFDHSRWDDCDLSLGRMVLSSFVDTELVRLRVHSAFWSKTTLEASTLVECDFTGTLWNNHNSGPFVTSGCKPPIGVTFINTDPEALRTTRR